MSFQDLLYDNVAIAFDRQLALVDQIGDWDWDADFVAGTISFTKKQLIGRKVRSSAIQVLGSESHVSDTWLWSWSAQAPETASAALEVASGLRARGEADDIDVFTHEQFSLDAVGGHLLASIAVGLYHADGYYVCGYDDGASFVLLTDRSFRQDVDRPVLRIAAVFPQFLEATPNDDHRRTLIGYLKHYGLTAERTTAGELRAVHTPTRDCLRASFDDVGRLAGMTVVNP